MIENLESEIKDLVQTLKLAHKNHLAKCIEDNWQKSALAYSKELNTWTPERPMEPELLKAFADELERLDIEKIRKEKILTSLNNRRILQTAPHLVATENPRMLSINWLGSLGIQSDDFYVVGMFSGVPFSNNFRPGRINMKSNSINLFPSTMQDGLVYRSLIPEKLEESMKEIPVSINKFFPNTTVGESYTKWALSTCQNIEKQILGKENLVYLDINEVVSNYLVAVLANKEHIFYKIFFDPATREEFVKTFGNETLFYMPVMMSKYETTRKVTMTDITNAEKLVKDLREQRFCPALITGFLTLAFLNDFKCFGSFSQVEYLPTYQDNLSKLSFMSKQNVGKVPTANLTTGSLSNVSYPADIIMGSDFKADPNILFGEMIFNIKDKLTKQ